MNKDLEGLTHSQIQKKIYQLNNLEKYRENNRRFRKNNPEKSAEYSKKYIEKLKAENIEKFREMNRKRALKYYYKHSKELNKKRVERARRTRQLKEGK